MSQSYEKMTELELWEEIKKRYADPLRPRNEKERTAFAVDFLNNKERLRETLQSDDGLLMEFFQKNAVADH